MALVAKSQLVHVLALACGMAVVYVLYAQGFTAGFYYDDFDHFDRLKGLVSTEAWVRYVFAGETGPFGRPLAMASLLLHLGDWPDATTQIFRVNTLVHLANGLLLVWLLLRTLRLCTPSISKDKQAWIALGAGLVWLSLPLLVSTSLIAIQRMTSLSAFFMLLGMLMYLYGLQIKTQKPGSALGWMSAGLFLGTLVSSLAKETGLLLPVYLLVLELTLWRDLRGPSALDTWRVRLLTAYFGLIVLYLVRYALVEARAGYVIRDFDLGERLLTEAVILWEYLRLGLIPRALSYSPFHDDYTPVSPLVGLFALIGWATLLFIAWRVRQRSPWFAFAVFWFLAGHLLESTVIPLELYFEHRNYLAMAGPVFALVWWLANLQERLAPYALTAYLMVLWLLLWQTTTLWGDRRLAAELWHLTHPTSPRAALNLAVYHANKLGDGLAALKTFDSTAAACPRCVETRLSAVALACHHEPPERIAARMADVEARIGQARPGPGSVLGLAKLAHMLHAGECSGYDLDQLERLNRVLLNNPSFRNWKGPRRGLHYNLYQLATIRGDQSAALRELQTIWEVAPDIDVVAPLASELVNNGQTDQARRLLQTVTTKAPRNPAVAWLWRREAESLARQIDALTAGHGGKRS